MTQVGDKFVERQRYGTDYGRTVKVAKVYKNGNIVFEGSTQQYRVMGDTAVATSGHFSSKTFVRVTPDLVEKIRQSHELQRAKNRLRDLSEILAAASRSNDPDKVLPLAELFKDVEL